MKVYLGILLFFFCSCNSRQKNQTKVIFHIKHAANQQVSLQTIAYANEKRDTLALETIRNVDERFTWQLPAGEERLYRIKIHGFNFEINFINDTPEITVYADLIRPDKYTIKGSPATISLKQFIDDQKGIAEDSRNKITRIDSLKRTGVTSSRLDSLNQVYNSGMEIYWKRYINYADTVKSPAAFMFIYNYIDFGKNYADLKTFITRTAKRFPDHPAIKKLHSTTLNYLKIFDVEYVEGNELPEVKLPDSSGKQVSTLSLKGKYIYMDFWSTWCPQCLVYDIYKIEAKEKLAGKNFEIVSIAVDAEKETWKKYIRNEKIKWINLIDEKMWEGTAVEAIKFDSIPYNILLSPDGKIIARAIRADSLLPVLLRMVK